MDRYELIKGLVERVKAYEASLGEGGEMGLEDFTNWLTESHSSSVHEQWLARELEEVEDSEQFIKDTEPVEGVIAWLISSMNLYEEFYMRKAMENTQLQSIKEFAYLITLSMVTGLSKSELIIRNVHEKTTGMEVIRRLLERKLITQQEDEQDKRSKILAITQQGREVLGHFFPVVMQVAHLMTGILSEHEKKTLVYLLKKLELFHYPIFRQHRQSSLDELGKLVKGKTSA